MTTGAAVTGFENQQYTHSRITPRIFSKSVAMAANDTGYGVAVQPA
jgi:hypothetical protein